MSEKNGILKLKEESKETKYNISIDDIKNSREDTIDFFSRLELSLIMPAGAVKPIKFSEKFDSKPLEWQVLYLKALTASQNIGMQVAYRERDAALEKLESANAQKNNAEKSVGIHKGNLVNAITQMNADKEALSKRLLQLEDTLRKKEQVIEELNSKLNNK